MAVTEGQLISDGTVVWKVKKIGSEVPAGTMQMFAGNTIPAGWLLCDGSAVSRTDYAKLFSAISTTWGTGDGSTTFNMPNSIGRFAEGAATSGSYKSAGLPDVKGSIHTHGDSPFELLAGDKFLTYGCFQDGIVFSPALSLSSTSIVQTNATQIHFSANSSNSIYGNSQTVQPNSFTVRYIIKY